MKKRTYQLSLPIVLTAILLLLVGVLYNGTALAQSGTRMGVFENLEIKPGVLVEVPVEIRDVTDLYAFDIELSFDPDYLEFEDADPNKSGIQPGFGTFLDPGMTLYNIIDPEESLIHVVMSQINPSEAKSGSGNLLVLYLTGLKTGQTTLEVTKVELSTRYGEAIPVSGVDAEIEIVTDAPVVTATPIPVIDPITITEIPTLDPSQIPPTPTTAPSVTPMPTRTATATPQPTQARTEALGATATSAPTRTATLAPTATQSQAATSTSQSSQSGTEAPAATVTRAEPTTALEPEVEETTAAEATIASLTEETLAAPAEQPNAEAEESVLDEANNSDERLLAKDTAQSPGKLLPWLIGAAVLLIIAVGVYFSSRKNRAISEEDK